MCIINLLDLFEFFYINRSLNISHKWQNEQLKSFKSLVIHYVTILVTVKDYSHTSL